MTTLDTLAPVTIERTRQTAPQIYESLREQILALALKPGAVLNRVDLAQHYGVSQTPIRDALQMLSAEGLVEVYAQHTTLVSRIRLHDARQALFLRRGVELEIVETICAWHEDDRAPLLEKLSRNLRQQASCVADGDIDGLQALDLEFHRLQYDAVGVAPLWAIVRKQAVHIDRLRRLNLPKAGKAKSVLADHKRILQALVEGDTAGARDALRQHLSGTLAFIDEVRARNPDYLAN